MKKAILVGLNIDNNEFFEEEMKELKGLAKADDYKVVSSLTQNSKSINKKFFIGNGKVETLKLLVNEYEADVVIFNDELSPLQYKNLEDELNITILDRTSLIIEIFKNRAKTKEAKLQVEVARLKYLLPRINNNEANYEQQAGGSFKNKGSGEKQSDIDKKNIRNKINQIEAELDKIALKKSVDSKKRIKSDIPLVSIVGYTNAGKSTLLNAFIEEYDSYNKKNVVSKDMLFATLDTTTRHIKFKDNKEILLSDTVGFINKLPHDLIRAFKSTLQDALNASLILLVADISSNEVLNQIEVTLDTLDSIGLRNDVPIIYVFNKADKIGLATIPTDENKVFISAKNRLNLYLIEKEIKKALFSDWKICKMFIPYENTSILSYLKDKANVIKQKNCNDGIMIEVEVSPKDFNNLNDYIWVDNKN